jgi:hypothetical protein
MLPSSALFTVASFQVFLLEEETTIREMRERQRKKKMREIEIESMRDI